MRFPLDMLQSQTRLLRTGNDTEEGWMRGSVSIGRLIGVRRPRTAVLGALGAVLMAMLLWGSSADAALVHPFLGQLVKPKPAKQKDPSPRFSPEVCGVSIDPGSGQIYVSDAAAGVAENAKREEFEEIPSVEIFNSSNEHIRRLDGHNTPEEEFEEFCSTTVNDKSEVLYVANGGGEVIYEFESKPEGKFLKKATIEGTETPTGEFSSELHVAVAQSTGKLYVADGENEAIYIYNELGKLESQLSFPAGDEEHRPGPIAINQSTGEVFVAAEGQELGTEETEEFGFVDVFSASGEFLRQISGRGNGAFPGFGSETEPILTGLAVGSDGDLFVSDGPRRAVFEFDAAGAFLGEITGTPGEGAGAPEQRFSEPFGVAVNVAGDVYVVDRTTERNTPSSELPGRVDIFGPSASGVPTVESESVSGLAATSATLHAAIDPTGTDTSYHFELGTASCAEATCVDLPALPGVGLGAGQVIQSVSVEAAGLLANTTYHYRVVLSYGPHGESTVPGPDRTFTTPTEGAGVELLDGRAWEMVSSPTKKSGAAFEAIPENGGLIEASPDGTALTYIATSPDDPEPEGNRSPTYTQTLANRIVGGTNGTEWSSQDIVLPGEGSVGARTGTGKQEYVYFTPDLSLSLVQPLGLTPEAEPPLTADAKEKTLYTRKSQGCERPPSSCYQALVTAESDTAGTKFGGKTGRATSGLSFVIATSDLNHVVLSSEVPLTTEPAVAESANLYEWTGRGSGGETLARAQQLQIINVLPEGAPAPHAEIGSSFVRRNAISDDGSHIVWSDANHLYQRDMTSGVTVQIDTPEAGIELTGQEHPRFETASRDGTKIFFTDEQRLTSNSTASRMSNAGVDLYEFDTTTGKLTDLTVDPQAATSGETAAVQGLIIGSSEDGSAVYFAANGVLSSAANIEGDKAAPGSCTPEPEHGASGARCNLYREEFSGAGWGQPTFVASLSAEDIQGFYTQVNNSNLQYVSARVSPNGRYLAFMSNRSLTGYDNRDTNAAAHDARDEEVFRYDSVTGEIRCASCDPSGARPAGVFDPGLASQSDEGLGLLVDRRDTWEGKWLAANLPGWTGYEGQTALYQSRYLSDGGRMFFNSVEPLASADRNAKNDVYEFESSGEGSCAVAGGCVALISSGSSKSESAFLDASASGNDVFFLTTSALVTSDHDFDFDVYDARVCGAEGCIPPQGAVETPCASAEACRGAGSPPVYAPPGSLTSATSGNAGPQSGVLPAKAVKPPVKKLTKAQQLAKALKTCKKMKQKKKRVACEKQARKKYGAKKQAAKKAAAKRASRGNR